MEDRKKKEPKEICNKKSFSKNEEAKQLKKSYKLGIKYYEEVDEK